MQDGLGSKICQRAVGNGDRLTNRWMDGWMLWHWHPVTGGWIWHAWLALLAEDRQQLSTAVIFGEHKDKGQSFFGNNKLVINLYWNTILLGFFSTRNTEEKRWQNFFLNLRLIIAHEGIKARARMWEQNTGFEGCQGRKPVEHVFLTWLKYLSRRKNSTEF